jgi:hypothetical protein
MNDQSKMSEYQTSLDSPNVTSLLGSEGGIERLSLPDGQTIKKFGPEVVPVSRSPSRASSAAKKTRAIYGPSSEDLSASGVLQSYLANRLRLLLNGSPECEVTWKLWITPWGQSLSKPRAVVRRNIEIVIGLWPAARANETLQNVVLACWPQNAARDWKNGKASQATMDRNSRPCNEMVFSVWSALRASDGAKGGPNQSFGAGGSPLPSQVAQMALSNSSNVQTENSVGSLHPEFAGWEMGYPPEWLNCAPSVTPSTRRRPLLSSVPTSTAAPSSLPSPPSDIPIPD